jgi:hypothetical protein
MPQGRGDLIVVESAVGSTPPSAGLTPAPSIQKDQRCGISSLLELLGPRRPNLTSPVILRERRPAGAAAGR